ncbi:putative PilT protein domain protein [Treponema primitia ZAS-2]|uniref:Putative PilT protein domain protein n=1 Tax=Treponema primitia (strain ATCC BAA-887 / DSM 12427 / ZAS-2) TaxID=545694 RepID=F5YQ77_TREPZ|nr:type II toxin-antitoxin system VapC family toxin [Treponema primitia]AEF83627.1 putative PilT protein domain protein [Treponema primitia ZAS-2]
MIVVLDSNAAIAIVLQQGKGIDFTKAIEQSEKVVSSEFFRIEVANVIRKYYKGNFINREQCNELLETAEGLVDEFIPIRENNIEAFNEAIRLDYSAYDMLYLSLARRTGATLLTLDHPLLMLAKKEGLSIIE